MNFLIQSGIGIGDTIQLLPMAKNIKKAFPDAKVDFIFAGNEKSYAINKQIIALQSYVNNIYWYSKHTIFHDLRLLLELRKNKYDIGFLRVENTTGSRSLWQYRIMRWCNCKEIIGCDYEKVDKEVKIPPNTHYLKRDALMLKAAGISAVNDVKTIDVSKLDHSWFKKIGISSDRQIISLSMGTNSVKWTENGKTSYFDVKSWPYDKWIELALRLSDLGYAVFLIGGPKEKIELQQKKISIPEKRNIYNFIGSTTIQQSLTLLNYSVLAVGAEGGMMHCASALGIPTLTIFGGSNPKCYNPGGENSEIISLNLECSPCFLTPRMVQCNNHKCLNDISVEIVLDKIKSILGRLISNGNN
jgi:ADP-heptose:LPS heptosyltransferase